MGWNGPFYHNLAGLLLKKPLEKWPNELFIGIVCLARQEMNKCNKEYRVRQQKPDAQNFTGKKTF